MIPLISSFVCSFYCVFVCICFLFVLDLFLFCVALRSNSVSFKCALYKYIFDLISFGVQKTFISCLELYRNISQDAEGI